MTEPKRFCALCKLLLEEHEQIVCAECASTRPVKPNAARISGYRTYLTSFKTACDGCKFKSECKAAVLDTESLPCYVDDPLHADYLAQNENTGQLEMELICAT